MPRKRPRTDADVERLATEFRDRWTPAEGITPWLRRMEPSLQRMVHDGSWSWADIGRAMTLAGIIYDSGKPWTGLLLTVKAAQARRQVRDRTAQASASAPPPSQGPVGVKLLDAQADTLPRSTPLPDQSRQGQGTFTPEPTFALASLTPGEFAAAKPASVGASKPPRPPARARVDPEEILRRLQGAAATTDRKD